MDRDMAVLSGGKQLSRAAAIITEAAPPTSSRSPPPSPSAALPGVSCSPGFAGAYLETGSPALLHLLQLMADHSVGEITLVSYRGEVIAVEAGDTTSVLYGGAIDIGTTSVVLYARPEQR